MNTPRPSQPTIGTVLFLTLVMMALVIVLPSRQTVTPRQIVAPTLGGPSSMEAPSQEQTVSVTFPEELPDPIYYEPTAIARSIAEFRKDVQPLDAVARIVSRDTAERWFHGESYDALGTVRAQMTPDNENQPVNLAAPCWLVGLAVEGMTVNDAIPIPGGVDDDSPVHGIFHLWDANGGELLFGGTLENGTRTSFASIQAMANEDIPVTPWRATFVRLATAAPTMTLTAIEWATMHVRQTVAARTPTP